MNDFAASSFLFFCSFGLFFVFQRAVRGTHTTKKRIVSVCLSEDGVCRAHGPGDHYRNGSALFITGFQENKQIEREDNVFSFILSQAFFCNIFFFFGYKMKTFLSFFIVIPKNLYCQVVACWKTPVKGKKSINKGSLSSTRGL